MPRRGGCVPGCGSAQARRRATKPRPLPAGSAPARAQQAVHVCLVHQAVGGQDSQARRVHVHEGHHHVPRVLDLRMLVAEGQRRFVAMVPVGDDQLLGCIACWMEAMSTGSEMLQSRCTAPYSSVTAAMGSSPATSSRMASTSPRGVRIQHEDLPEMRARVAQQFQAVLLGAAQSLLVAVHDAGRVVFHRAEPDEALADQPFAGIGYWNSWK